MPKHARHTANRCELWDLHKRIQIFMILKQSCAVSFEILFVQRLSRHVQCVSPTCVCPTTLQPVPCSVALPWWHWRHSYPCLTRSDGGSPHTVEPACRQGQTQQWRLYLFIWENLSIQSLWQNECTELNWSFLQLNSRDALEVKLDTSSLAAAPQAVNNESVLSPLIEYNRPRD